MAVHATTGMEAGVSTTIFGGAQAEAIGRPALVGATVGRYRVRGRLGSGAMGVVYRAYDPDLDRDVAVKVLRADATGDAAATRPESTAVARARFIQEAQTMAQLNHPNVVPVFDASARGGHRFIAMELVEGETVKEWLGQRRSWRTILGAYIDAGRGLAAAHVAGLVHRDFKPSNVLIGRDGRARVMDFGLAMPYTAEPSICITATGACVDREATLTLAGKAVGTPAYMAPEQHSGAAPDARSDQFSFCCALFEALVGRRPFLGRSCHEIAVRKQLGRMTPAPLDHGVPKRLLDAVVRGLAVKPADRYRSMDALLAALQRAARPRSTPLAITMVLALCALVGGLAFGVAGYARVPHAAAAHVGVAAHRAAAGASLRQAVDAASRGAVVVAEAALTTAYFDALDVGAHALAATAARHLSGLMARHGRPAEARRWSRHAQAEARRGA